MEEQPDRREGEPSPAQSPQQAQPPPGPPPVGRKKSGRRKLILWMSLALLSLLIIAGLTGGLYAWRFLDASRDVAVHDVDMSQLPDGVYLGAYSVFHVRAEVEVEVRDGRVVSIALLDSGRMSEDARREIEEIFDKVINSQSLGVDIGSGASVSKKVSLKAVEEAIDGENGGP